MIHKNPQYLQLKQGKHPFRKLESITLPLLIRRLVSKLTASTIYELGWPAAVRWECKKAVNDTPEEEVFFLVDCTKDHVRECQFRTQVSYHIRYGRVG